jgi:hypothetical protein
MLFCKVLIGKCTYLLPSNRSKNNWGHGTLPKAHLFSVAAKFAVCKLHDNGHVTASDHQTHTCAQKLKIWHSNINFVL